MIAKVLKRIELVRDLLACPGSFRPIKSMPSGHRLINEGRWNSVIY